MKFKISLIAIVSLLVFSILGCENENLIDKQSVSFNNLKKFNQENYSKGDFWDTVGEISSIAGADIIGAGTAIWAAKEIIAYAGASTGGTGAMVGAGLAGVVGGAGASYSASQQFKSNSSGLNLNYNIPVNYEELDIGHYHNRALEEVYYGNKSKVDFLNNIYEPEIVNIIMSDNDFINNYNEIINITANNHRNISNIINKYHNDNMISVDMKVFYNLFFEAVSNTNNQEDLQDVINVYSSHISNQPYTEIEKRALFASLSVAASSFNYWSNK